MKTVEWKLPAFLGLLAILIYVPLIGWGLPNATAPDRTKSFAIDEILPTGPLIETQQMLRTEPLWTYKGYPFLQYFIDAVFQAPYAAYLYFSGQMKTPLPGHPLGLNDPASTLRILEILGRCVTLLMAGLTVVAAFVFSHNLFGRTAGIVAAILVMLNCFMVYYSRTGNVDVPAFFWIAIGMVLFGRILDAGLTARRAAWLGAVAAFAMATKDQAVAFFLPIGLALLLPRFQGGTHSYPVKPLLAGLGASLAAYAAATGMLLHPSRHISHVMNILGKDPVSARLHTIGGMGLFWGTHPRTLAGMFALAGDYGMALTGVISLPVVAACCIGIWLAARRSPGRLIVLLPVLSLFLIVVVPLRFVVWRYCLPLSLPICAFAAYAIVQLRKFSTPPLWIGAMVLICGYQALMDFDLCYSQWNDTRYDAGRWLQSHARRGDKLGYFGDTERLPQLGGEIVTWELVRDPDLFYLIAAGDPAKESEYSKLIMEELRAERPEYVIEIPDWTSTPGMEHSAYCPTGLYRYLLEGKGEYRPVAYFPARSLFSGILKRPRMDYPSVSPAVRIFVRRDLPEAAAVP
jgi:hypothetical protein